MFVPGIPKPCWLLALAIGLTLCMDLSARQVSQETGDSQTEQNVKISDKAAAEQQKLLDSFQKNLSNTKFIGQFTVTGMESGGLKKEEYTITKVRKLPKDDLWEINARIKYGDHDVTVPMVMAVKWAGKTPVITVDRMLVPGLGTFDARVLLRKDKYAGTWSHGKVGGHLFGNIEKIEDEESKDVESKEDTKK